MKLISQARYAKRTGYSRARISQLVKQGVITLIEGKVSPDQASQGIREKIFRPQRLEKLSRKKPIMCDKCKADERQEPETFFCKRLDVTILKRAGTGGVSTTPVDDA